MLDKEHRLTIDQLIKPFVAFLLTSGCTLALAATPLTDAEFQKDIKPEVALKDCKKENGTVVVATTVGTQRFDGKWHVYVAGEETGDPSSHGRYAKKPTQAQLDSLKGKKYSHTGF